MRRNPNYTRRRQILNALDEVVKTYNSTATTSSSSTSNANQSYDGDVSTCSLEDNTSLLDVSMDSLSEDLQSLMTSDDDCASSTSGSSDTSSDGSCSIRRTPSTLTIVKQPLVLPSPLAADVCNHCQNNYKSCDFCHKNLNMNMLLRTPSYNTKNTSVSIASNSPNTTLPTYSPVYNIREIRTATHSFSFLGSDKKLLDIELNGRLEASSCRLRPQSVYMSRSVPRMILDATSAYETTSADEFLAQDINGNRKATTSLETTTLAGEAVNNDPSKGLGHFVYI